MKSFKIYYTIRTQSRYGAYDYHLNKIIEAETEIEAKNILKTLSQDFKRYKLIFRKISEI